MEQINFFAVYMSIAFLIGGMLIAWLAKRGGLAVESNFWVIIFAPLLFYLVFSGTLKKFSGGGFSAEFAERASLPIPKTALSSEDLIGAEALNADLSATVVFAHAQRVIAIKATTVERLPHHRKEQLAALIGTAIYQSILAGGFAGLIVVDDGGKPIGLFEKSFFLEVIRLPLDRIAVSGSREADVLTNDQVISRLLETQLWPIIQHPSVRAEREGNKVWIEKDVSRVEAFKTMTRENVEIAAVVDDDGEYIGAITRDRLTGLILTDLIEVADQP